MTGFVQTVSAAAPPRRVPPTAPEGVVQRAMEAPPESSEATEKQSKPPDLEAMARQILPMVKRMLMVERERRQILR